eukprot:Gregarina_sp_Pseudo_9__1171@NODE_176_length_3816_cov_36_555732_g162_i0_p1_GENE_NODE_176_length_3816_cov_36_555732_g162_i0NODE_176_length_3816_cov_36_555732_g162_i0_p1_ORF_typecomplete_len242_score48_77_NODE_176_length_3816_cov_36_555732_g162_i022312956
MRRLFAALCVTFACASWSNLKRTSGGDECSVKGKRDGDTETPFRAAECEGLTGEISEAQVSACVNAVPVDCVFEAEFSSSGKITQVCDTQIPGFSMESVLPGVGKLKSWRDGVSPRITLNQGITDPSVTCVFVMGVARTCGLENAMFASREVTLTGQPFVLDQNSFLLKDVAPFFRTIGEVLFLFADEGQPKTCNTRITDVTVTGFAVVVEAKGLKSTSAADAVFWHQLWLAAVALGYMAS